MHDELAAQQAMSHNCALYLQLDKMDEQSVNNELAAQSMQISSHATSQVDRKHQDNRNSRLMYKSREMRNGE
jgi:hypothetical protein